MREQLERLEDRAADLVGQRLALELAVNAPIGDNALQHQRLVSEHRSAGHADCLGQIGHGRLVVAVAPEVLVGRANDLLAAFALDRTALPALDVWG